MLLFIAIDGLVAIALFVLMIADALRGRGQS